MVVGIDYTEEYTQVSYARAGMKQPESVSTSIGEQKYLIPTVTCMDRKTGAWFIGDKALDIISSGEVCFFKDILLKALWDECEVIDEVQYEYKNVLTIFLKSILELVMSVSKDSKIDRIIFTHEEENEEIKQLLVEIVVGLGVDIQNIKVISHSESFAYYMINQPVSLWTLNVALFDFTASAFIYRQLSASRTNKPLTVMVKEENLTDIISIQTIQEPETADMKFCNILRTRVDEEPTSAVYLNGVGFSGDWMAESITSICNGRKAFQGQNIFCKGACYMALYPKLMDSRECLVLCKGKNRINLSIVIEDRGENMLLSLL